MLPRPWKNISMDIITLRKKDWTKLIDEHIRKSGNLRVLRCQFHAEDTPSFYIYPDNTFFCFGCRAHGNAVDFVMKKFDYTFTQACELLKDL